MGATLLLLSSIAVTTAQPAPLVIRAAPARVVGVDAYVFDRKSRPISGLTVDDFELVEDGKLVSVAAFEGPRRRDLTRGSSPSRAHTDTGSTPSSEDGLTAFFFVDRWMLSARGRKLGVDQAEALALKQIENGARVAVIADEAGLKPLTPLTKDPVLVQGAFRKIQTWATSSPGVGERKETIERIKLIPNFCTDGIGQAIEVIRGYAAFRSFEVRDVADRLTLLVNALVGFPGRKALIYLGEGLEQRPGIDLFDQLGSMCPGALATGSSGILTAAEEIETSSFLREVTSRANSVSVTFYPIDARGLEGFSQSDLTHDALRDARSPRQDMIREANLTNPLKFLAEETGGFAMLRGMPAEISMKRFVSDEQGHYILGFVPGEPDGKKHSLRVRLTRKAQAKHEASIRHRQSYLRAELPSRRGQRAMAALLFGLEEHSLPVDVEVTRISPTEARVTVAVSLGELEQGTSALSVSPEAHIHVVVSLLQHNLDKALPVARERDVTFNLAELRDANDPRRSVVVDVPAGGESYTYAIGVEDGVSGRATYVRRELPAATPPPARQPER